MHFFDTWSQLGFTDSVRLVVPVALLLLAIVLPGRRNARLAAAGLALTVPLLRELSPWPLAWGWSLLWAGIAWQVGRPRDVAGPESAARPGGFESGTVGMFLGLALLTLLIAAVARQDLAPAESRRASYALLVLGLGLLHLMLRRHALRATIAFAALGLGLELLESAARDAELPGTAPAPGGVLLATAVAVTIAVRLARARERAGGTMWVSQAHDLHD